MASQACRPTGRAGDIWGAVAQRQVHAQTGYEAEAFEFAVRLYVLPYYAQMNAVVSTAKAAFRFKVALHWIHMRPTKVQFQSTLGISYGTFQNAICPLLKHLSTAMDEVHWSDRLHPMNHTRVFPTRVTTVMDTAFVPVSDSRDRQFAKFLFSGKYHSTGLKLEVTCNVMGHIVDFKFPAGLGTSPDYTIHNCRVQAGEKAFLWWEWCLADGIYFGSEHVIAKFPRNFNDITVGGRKIHIPLTRVQSAANRVISHDRQRIEHIVGLINRHVLFRLSWSGCHLLLARAMHVTCHMTNIKIRLMAVNATAQNGFARYADVIGPYPHDGT